MEECRAILVSEYLTDNKELLATSRYTDASEVTAEDRDLCHPEINASPILLLQFFTLPISISALTVLKLWNSTTLKIRLEVKVHHQIRMPAFFLPLSHIPRGAWLIFRPTSPLSKTSFRMVEVSISSTTLPSLSSRFLADHDKILSCGRPALGIYLYRLLIWRCAADVPSPSSSADPCVRLNAYTSRGGRLCVRSRTMDGNSYSRMIL